MDKLQHQNIPKSREEIIKIARESCAKNLTSGSKRIEKNYRGYINSNREISNGFIHITSIKIFIIRLVCAIAIFLTIITISSLDKKYNTSYGTKIEGWVTDNVRLENVEDFFVSVFEKVNND